MNDAQCVHFLQWVLPQLHMRWPGFRRVRRQVCKRLRRRITQLQLGDLSAYQTYLAEHSDEWPLLDGLCQITISRFYRDKMVFSFLQTQVFPHLLQLLEQDQETTLRIWCSGCGAGEEPYSLAMLWATCFQAKYPGITLSIMATDINPEMLQRARQACYPYSAIKNLPSPWRETGFERQGEQYCLQPSFKRNINFHCQDIRDEAIAERQNDYFHLICCRNLAFTYFDGPLQREIAQRFHDRLVAGGVLLLGVHEALPLESPGFDLWSQQLAIYLRH